MTLLDEIRALHPAILDRRDTFEIAKALSVDRVALMPGTLMGEGLVMTQLGFNEGDQVLAAFEAVATKDSGFKRALRLLADGRLDIGVQVTRDSIARLVEIGVLTPAQLQRLLAPGVRPAAVDEMDVRQACWSDNGNWIP